MKKKPSDCVFVCVYWRKGEGAALSLTSREIPLFLPFVTRLAREGEREERVRVSVYPTNQGGMQDGSYIFVHVRHQIVCSVGTY